MSNRRSQVSKGYKPRQLPTSGFGTHGDDLKDADKKAARGGWKNTRAFNDEVNNWKEFV